MKARRSAPTRRSTTAARTCATGSRPSPSGEIPKIPFNLALLKERAILGVYRGDWARAGAIHGRQVTGKVVVLPEA